MFTGIIELLGKVEAFESRAGGARMTVVPERAFDNLVIGESVATEGVCLTVEDGSHPDRLHFFLTDETLNRSTHGEKKAGRIVNLERSLAVGDRMGGHFVMGHVDAVGKIVRLERRGEAWDLEVAFPKEFRRYLAPKGSVAVDGISLTVVEIRGDAFTVAVIPHTRDATSLREKCAGDKVNLEADVLARYVAESMARGDAPLTESFIREAGF